MSVDHGADDDDPDCHDLRHGQNQPGDTVCSGKHREKQKQIEPEGTVPQPSRNRNGMQQHVFPNGSLLPALQCLRLMKNRFKKGRIPGNDDCLAQFIANIHIPVQGNVVQDFRNEKVIVLLHD